MLQRLPSSGGGLNSKFNNSGNLGNPPDGGGVGAGAAEIDLRYLGSRAPRCSSTACASSTARRRSGVPGSVDLNSIPECMIERVEVLQDGASAIYGSDAIAGVVNIITKQRQSGFVASAQLGGYEQGDGFTQNYQLSWGNGSDGPLQVVVGGNYVKQKGIFAGDRAISAFPAPYADELRRAAAARASLRTAASIGSIRASRTAATTARSDQCAGRARRRSRIFRPTSSASPADRFNFAPFNYIQIPLERYGGFGS